VQACTGTECSGPVLGQPGGGGAGADGGATNAGSAGEGGETATLYSVTRFDGEAFDRTSPYAEAAQVLVERAGGGPAEEALWSGSEGFELPDAAPSAFVLVTPADAMVDATRTLSRIPANPAESEELVLVRPSTIEAILALAAQALEQEAGRAQVVIRLREAQTGTPIAGARLSLPSAQTVLYAANGTFSDAVSETDSSGLALLINVSAGAWPGELGSITISGSVISSTPVRAIADAVTVLSIEIER
jgi:hypothetical protein